MKFVVKKEDLQSIYRSFKERRMRLKDIDIAVGSGFRNALYSGYCISEKVKEKIEHLLGTDVFCNASIKTNDEDNPPEISKSPKLAEMFGILLGDGNITSTTISGKRRSIFSISLNYIDSKDYVIYVEKMVLELFGKKCSRVIVYVIIGDPK